MKINQLGQIGAKKIRGIFYVLKGAEFVEFEMLVRRLYMFRIKGNKAFQKTEKSENAF